MAEMNTNTAELLQQMIDIKKDMRTAISNKGVTVVSGMESYPSAIDSIQQEIIGGSAKLPDGTKFSNSTFTTVPLFDTSAMTNMSGMFRSCYQLTTVPQFNTSNVTDMNEMFYGCSKLNSVPLFNTSNVTDMYSMFYGCTELTTVPLFDTSNVTNMGWMFSWCNNKLTTVPQFNTSNVTNMDRMLHYCYQLTTVPQFNTSNVTNMNEMFRSCINLTTIPQFDTSKVTDMGAMFENCRKLTDLPILDLSKCTSVHGMFRQCYNLTNIGGFIQLGKAFRTRTHVKWHLEDSAVLTRESCINIFNNLSTLNPLTNEGSTLTFNPAVIAKLSADDIAIATNKGWIIAEQEANTDY